MRQLVVALSVVAAVAQGLSSCDQAVQRISAKGGQDTSVSFGSAPTACTNPSLSVNRDLSNGGKLAFDGLTIKVSDVPNEDDRNSFGAVTLNCNGAEFCKRAVILDITKFVAPPATTTAAPVAVGGCSWKVGALQAKVGTSVTGDLSHSDLTSKCMLTNFKLDTEGVKGKITYNSKGMIGFYASETPEQVQKEVLVSCDGKPHCKLNVWFDAFADAPTEAPPVTVAPPPVPAACPGRYYFNAELATTLSATLEGHSKAQFCAGSRTFKKLQETLRGKLTLWPNGAFHYTTPSSNDDDSFSFQMECDGQFVCIGQAFIFSRLVDHSQDTEAPSAPGTAPPVTYTPSKFQTCSGSCIADAWANGGNAADAKKWDFGLKQASGRSVGSVDVTWSNGALNINAYGKIGRLAERFPTFEKVTAGAGSQFNGSEVLKQAAQSSLPFDATCLNNQENVGLGAEVWHSTANTLGDRYRKGSSWFQKFGGVHDQCDTFANSCNYAPLLSPKRTQDETKGTWSVDINNCDVTWKGLFPRNALLAQKKSDGSRVWKTTNDRRLQATLYSESVKPARWVDHSAGILEQTEEYKLSVKLSEWVSITKTDSSSSGTHSPFTLDPEFFEYTTEKGDRAFGLNMLFYPEATDNVGGRTNFAADRRVHGFRVVKQSWSTQCPTCKNTGKKCTINTNQDSDDLFVASGLQAMKCDDGSQPVITLSKGPSAATDSCETTTFGRAKNLVVNRAGFSKPRDCAKTFQNLTLRGIAVGSAKSGVIDFDGKIEVQLLLGNGNRASLSIDISLFVSMLSTSGSTEDGNVQLCRASPYFPVYDPLGTSLPDRRHHLSRKLPIGVYPHLCVDQLDNDFGPEGWAVLGFDIEKLDSNSLRVEQFGLRYPGSNGDVMMIYNDANGKPANVPTSVGTWWQETHPFLAFRDISPRAKNRTITSPKGPVMTNSDFAFALMPGSINVEVDMDVFCVIAVLDTKGDVVSRPVLRQRIHVDPILTSESRNGPERVADIEDEEQPDSPYFFFATSGVMIAVIALAAIGVSNDMIPVAKKGNKQ